MHADDDELPNDPDLDYVPEELRLLAGLNHSVVTLVSEDGVSQDTLVIVPGMIAHGQRVTGDE